MNILFNFIDIGAEALTHDVTWFFPVSVRADKIKVVQGNFSCMLRRFLNHFLYGARGISTAGVPLMLHGQAYLLRAELVILLTDGGAWPQALQWSGAGSIKPCFKHGNVLKRDCILSGTEGFVNIDCANVREFQAVKHDDLYDDVDSCLECARLHELDPGNVDLKNNLARMHYVTGLKPTTHGLLADLDMRRKLDIMKLIYLDWPHTFLQEGVLSNELTELIRACKTKLNVQPSFWEARLKGGWNFPSQTRVKQQYLYRLFNDFRIPEGSETPKVHGNMAEMLGVYGLIRHIIETDPVLQSDLLAQERESFHALCRVLDLVLDVKFFRRRPAQTSAIVLAAHAEYMRLSIAAYGRRHCKPKMHWVFDIAQQWENDDLDMLFDTFTIERWHLRVRRIAQHVHNLARFEKSVLSVALTEQHAELQKTRLGNGLRGSLEQLPGTGISVANALEIYGLRFGVGDVVTLGNAVGQVVGCAEEGGILNLIVDELQGSRHLTATSRVASTTVRRRSVWSPMQVRRALAWYEGDGSLVVLDC